MADEDQPSDLWVAQYEKAAGKAAVFELKIRMLADMLDKIRSEAPSTGLEPLVKLVIAELGDKITADDAAHLKRCANLRNKLFHLELSRASGLIKDFGVELRSGGVYMLDTRALPADGDLDAMPKVDVSQTATRTGRIFGWLMNAAVHGHFAEAEILFTKARRLVAGAVEKLNDEE